MSKSNLCSFALAVSAVAAVLSCSSAQRAQHKSAVIRTERRTIKLDTAVEKSLRWQPLGEPGSGGAITGFSFDPRNGKRMLMSGDLLGVGLSEDAGKTWLPTFGLKSYECGDFTWHPTNPNIAWAALGNFKPLSGDCLPGGIYKTTDGGKSWHSISAGLSQAHNPDSNSTARYKAFAVCVANLNVMYTADDAWNTGVVYGTKDGSKSWRAQATKYNVGNDNNDPARQKISQVKTAYFAGIAGTVMAVDPKNSNAAYCLGTEYMLATTDDGATWFDGGNNLVSNNHWRGREFSGLCCTGFFFNPARPDDALLTAMDAGKLWRSTDDLHSWEYHGLEPWFWGGGVCAVYAGNRIYSTAGQFGQFLGILRSTDDGKTFKPIGGSEHGLPALQAQNAQPSAIYAHPNDPLKVDVIIAGKLYQSVDGGEQWKIVQAGLNLNWLIGDTKKPERVYLSGEHGVYVTTDDGVTVQNIGGPKPASRLSIDSKGRLYAASWRTDQGGVWRWDGERWTRLWNNGFVHQIASDPTRIAVATHDNPYHDITYATGVWVSADDGKTWRQANDGLPVLRGESITFDPHHLRSASMNVRIMFASSYSDFLCDSFPIQ